MENEITKYRDSRSSIEANDGHGVDHQIKIYWTTGFDAAIELNLPVKFLRWASGLERTHKDDYYLFMAPTITDRWLTEPELYKYWIENIYKPE